MKRVEKDGTINYWVKVAGEVVGDLPGKPAKVWDIGATLFSSDGSLRIFRDDGPAAIFPGGMTSMSSPRDRP